VKECFSEYNRHLRFDSAVLETVVAGSRGVVAVVTLAMRPAGVSAPVRQRWGYVCEVAGGRITRFRAYVDPDEAFEAAGATS
jgi:ketosteroid isomerase-like protein